MPCSSRYVRQPPIVVAGEVHGVERRHVPPERVGPGVQVVLVVDRPVVRELLPHEPGVHVRDRPVPVVGVGERGALAELAVLPRAGARDGVPITVPTRRLPGRRQRATTSAARSEQSEWQDEAQQEWYERRFPRGRKKFHGNSLLSTTPRIAGAGSWARVDFRRAGSHAAAV